MDINYNIWLGHHFSTAFHFIDLIKNNPEDIKFRFYVTNNNVDSITSYNSDFFELEPIFQEEADYIDYCINFSQKHNIDIFIPNYKKLDTISKNIAIFKENNIKVLIIDNYNLLNTLDDKVNCYKSFSENKIMSVPEHYIARNYDEFRTYYKTIIENNHKVCIKPRYSSSGMGFRIISNYADSYESLLDFANPFLSYNHLCSILEKKDTFNDLIISEYLDGTEYSIDILSDGIKVYAMIPRKKLGKRKRVIEYNQELIDICNKIHNNYNVPYIYNVQIKYKNEIPKLIEINPRMSGGLHISCLSGVNYPFLAIKLLLGQKIEITNIKYNINTTYIEKEIIL
ncbi:MAG: ATP-grasp domain-containing protein [Candidatus Sericytochromatia bacterium]